MTCNACGEGRERLKLYMRDGVPQVMRTCDHCHVELFGDLEHSANMEAMKNTCVNTETHTALTHAVFIIKCLRDGIDIGEKLPDGLAKIEALLENVAKRAARQE